MTRFASTMMKNFTVLFSYTGCVICLALFVSCQEQKVQRSIESHPELIGTWVLTDRIIDGIKQLAQDRIVKLVFKSDGTFATSYRGDNRQQWVHAGRGAYLYDSPYLSLHWDSGRVVPLLLSDLNSESFKAHHGREMAPLKEQEPDEIFKKVKKEMSPTQNGS